MTKSSANIKRNQKYEVILDYAAQFPRPFFQVAAASKRQAIDLKIIELIAMEIVSCALKDDFCHTK